MNHQFFFFNEFKNIIKIRYRYLIQYIDIICSVLEKLLLKKNWNYFINFNFKKVASKVDALCTSGRILVEEILNLK